MRLYVGNATRQNHQFLFRMMGENDGTMTNKIHQQTIPHGQQIRVAGDMTTEEIEYIIRQHRPYGLLPVSEISKARGFHGLCYSIDKPISVDGITYLFDHNIGVLDVEGKERRRASAITSNNYIDQTMQEAGRPERMQEFDLTLQEDRPTGDANEVPQLAEGIKVRVPEAAPATTGRRRRRST